MRSRMLVTAVFVSLLAAACSNSTSEGTTTTSAAKGGDSSATQVAVTAPGVTADEIRVGGVASTTNPLGGKDGESFDGVKAYFAMVNSEGGIYGRDLTMASERDDQLSNNDAEVQGLLEQDNVFAALPMTTLLFTGSDRLVQSGIPTFGWTINPEWQGTTEVPKLNLFGQAGSYLCLGCEQPQVAYVAKISDSHKIGVLAYNVPQSTECAEGWEKTFDIYGEEADAEVVFSDKSLSYGITDLSVQVSKMKDAGVDMVVTCVDTNAVVTLGKELKKQAVSAIQFLPNGYDQAFLDEFGDLFEGSYAWTSFAPIESKPQPKGMKNYLKWMEATNGRISENSLVGWLNADLFVTGLRKAGPNFDQQKVVSSINEITDYTADGLLSSIDWSNEHNKRGETACGAVLIVKDSKFVPVTIAKGKPFSCFALNTGVLTPTAQ